MVNPMDLTGKHIIVTGASDGIGQSACIQASKLGAHISMIARNEEKLKQTISLVEGNNHNYYVFDLNETDNIGKLVKDIVKERGNIDGLVHCAGISKNYPIKILKTEYAETMMRIHRPRAQPPAQLVEWGSPPGARPLRFRLKAV